MLRSTRDSRGRSIERLLDRLIDSDFENDRRREVSVSVRELPASEGALEAEVGLGLGLGLGLVGRARSLAKTLRWKEAQRSGCFGRNLLISILFSQNGEVQYSRYHHLVPESLQ